MIYGSVCSGIEAATVAWHPLGWRAAFFSEIEAFPSALLSHYYPDVPNHGDMTKFKEWPDATLDVLVGGTPCQSFSVAGLRKGLDDPRGNLTLVYLAIAARYRPRWVVWENVPGVLSDKTGAFGAFLGGLGELGYGFAYRVLDAQYFGVPQRRRRVFVVGCLGDWRRAAAVLFERHSLQGNPAPRRQAGQGVAQRVADSLTKCRAGSPDEARGTANLIPFQDVAPTLNAHFGSKQGLEDQHIRGGVDFSLPAVAMCLNAGAMGRQDAETETLIPTNGGGFDVAHAMRGEGFDASEDGTGRGTPLVPVVAGTLKSNNGGGGFGSDPSETFVPVAFAASDYEKGEFEQCDSARPLTTSADRTRAAPIVAFSSKDHGADAGEIAPTLRSMGGVTGNDAGGGSVAVAFKANGAKARSDAVYEEVSPTLNADAGGNTTPRIASAMQVRRLTPRECERLQGFSDDYTLIPYRSKPAADGPRYKALGNSMAVLVMRWIGERIAKVDAIKEQQDAA